MNVVVLVGAVARPPERRELGTGQSVISFDLSVPGEVRGSESVPVAWPDPDPKASIDEGDTVVVVGRVRRRFFRAGGATASRVELEADVVARAGDRRRVQAAFRRAAAALASLEE